MADEPQAAGERREVARHLVQSPMVTKERDPDRFRLIRRHESELDRWFTQRLGYRLHVDGDTARLYKTGYVPDHRPLRTGNGRPFHRREYVLLSLVLAATSAGPDVISLRDLVDQVRSAAAETGIVLTDEHADRRALVSALTWLIERGLAVELHAHVDAYASDGEADAVLKLRPDRIVLLALPALAGAADADTLLAQAERRSGSRQWMRARLVEDPVLYRSDLTDAEWSELRRRLGDEAAFLDEMFGLRLEARAEGVAAIDPDGSLTEVRFPTSGTVGHAALLLLGELAPRIRPHTGGAASAGDDHDGSGVGPVASDVVEVDRVRAALGALVEQHASHWSRALLASPDRLLAGVLDLLVRLRLVALVGAIDTVDADRSRPSAAGNGSVAPAGFAGAPDPHRTAGSGEEEGAMVGGTVERAASLGPDAHDEWSDNPAGGGAGPDLGEIGDPDLARGAGAADGPEADAEEPTLDDAGVAAIAAALGRGHVAAIRLLPAAGRFVAEGQLAGRPVAAGDPPEVDTQASLW